MGFSRQEYWGGLPFLFPGDVPDPGIEPGSPALQADSLPPEPPGKLLIPAPSRRLDAFPTSLIPRGGGLWVLPSQGMKGGDLLLLVSACQCSFI